jgi:hypothetical protein
MKVKNLRTVKATIEDAIWADTWAKMVRVVRENEGLAVYISAWGSTQGFTDPATREATMRGIDEFLNEQYSF